MTRVSAIVVTYNSGSVIRDCLGRLATCSDLQIIVVDNASSDDTVAIAASVGADIVRNPANLGFAAAVNVGARLSEAEFILLLNPDAVISSGALSDLVDVLRSDPLVGAVAPRLTSPTAELAIESAGWDPTLRHVFNHYTGLSRLDATRFPGFYLLGGASHVGPIDWVSGGCVLLRRSAFEAAEGLSERWFMYSEDLDFCIRIRRMGFKVVYRGDVEAIHLVGSSSGGHISTTNTAWVCNLADLYGIWFASRRGDLLVWRAVVGCGLLFRSLAYCGLSVAKRSRREQLRGRGRHMLRSGLAVVRPFGLAGGARIRRHASSL